MEDVIFKTLSGISLTALVGFAALVLRSTAKVSSYVTKKEEQDKARESRYSEAEKSREEIRREREKFRDLQHDTLVERVKAIELDIRKISSSHKE